MDKYKPFLDVLVERNQYKIIKTGIVNQLVQEIYSAWFQPQSLETLNNAKTYSVNRLLQ